MTFSGLVLVVISALLHPLWNLMLKRSDDKLIFYTNIHVVFSLFFSFILFLYPLDRVSLSGWGLVILSAFAHFFYQVFLCRAYDEGDLSLTYPIIRSSPVFILVFAFLFLGEVPTFPAIVGVVLILIGTCVIHQNSFRFSRKSFVSLFANKAIFFAALTALFSALYSIVDKKAVLAMSPVLFFYLFFALSGALFLGYVLLLREKRKKFWNVVKKDYAVITLASLLEFASYVLILYAFQKSNTAYVTALRQISVVFGVLYGLIFMKEKFGAIRLTVSIMIFVGAFLIVVYG